MTDDNPGGRETLEFDSDAGSSRSKWVAGGLVVALTLWMGSGFVLPAPENGGDGDEIPSPRAIAVAVQTSQAKEVEQVFVAEGQAMPDRSTAILAESTGQIAEVAVERGDIVEGGAPLIRFETTQRQADLERATQEQRRAQREFDNAQTLLDRGTATVDRVSQARATLAAAQAQVTAAEEALRDTVVRAPFAGRLETLSVNTGEFVNAGAEVARIVDNSPLSISIQVPQQQLRSLHEGLAASVRFITGEEVNGDVRFVGSTADSETRTFTAEIEVPNEGGKVPAGISAQVRIPTGTQTAHFVSPAILSLGTDGTLGVKTVGDGDKVVFHEVSIVRAQTDGVWVAGLPDTARIITVGQAFVNDGETVDPRPEEDLSIDPAEEDAPATPEAESESASPDNGQIVGSAAADGARTELAEENR